MLVQKVLEPPPIKLTITLIHFVFVLTFFLILVFSATAVARATRLLPSCCGSTGPVGEGEGAGRRVRAG